MYPSTANAQSHETSPQKHVIAIILDVKLDESSNANLLEAGNVFSSNFFRADLNRSIPMRDKVLQALAEINKVYSEYVPENPIKNVIHCSDVLAAIKSRTITKGIIVLASGFTYDHDRYLQLQTYCEDHRLHDIIVLNANTIRFCYNKLMFNKACQLAKAVYPQTWIINVKKHYSLDAILQSNCPYFIIKPAEGTTGDGNTIVSKSELTKVLKGINEYSNRDPKLKDFYQFWDRDSIRNNLALIPCLVQEFIPGQLLAVNTKKYDPTIRVILVATVENNEVRVCFSDAYYKLPEEPIGKSNVTRNNRISAVGTKDLPHLNAIELTSKHSQQLFSLQSLTNFKNLILSMITIKPRSLWTELMQPLTVKELPNHPYHLFMLIKVERANATRFATEELKIFKNLIITQDENCLDAVVLILRNHYFCCTQEHIPVFKRNNELHSFALQIAKTGKDRCQAILKYSCEALLLHYEKKHELRSDEFTRLAYVCKYTYYQHHLHPSYEEVPSDIQADLKKLQQAGFNVSLQSDSVKNTLFFKSKISAGFGPWSYFGHFSEENLPLKTSPEIFSTFEK